MSDPNGVLGAAAAAAATGPAPTSGQHPFPQQFGAGAFAPAAQFGQQFNPFQQQQQQQPQQQQPQSQGPNQDQLRTFWQGQMVEVEQVGNDPAEFKNHQLPLARIKKIMKSDEDVRMISAEAPVLFAKACEMFILELTLRSWIHSEENKRRTLQRNDIAAAITKTDIFDFLVDIVPREEAKPDQPEQPRQPAALPMQGIYYPYPGMPQGSGPDLMARPALPMDPALMYQQQAFLGLQGQQWPQGGGLAGPMPAAGPAPPAADASSQQ